MVSRFSLKFFHFSFCRSEVILFRRRGVSVFLLPHLYLRVFIAITSGKFMPWFYSVLLWFIFYFSSLNKHNMLWKYVFKTNRVQDTDSGFWCCTPHIWPFYAHIKNSLVNFPHILVGKPCLWLWKQLWVTWSNKKSYLYIAYIFLVVVVIPPCTTEYIMSYLHVQMDFCTTNPIWLRCWNIF